MASFPPKFDLGPDVDAAPMPQHIPWGYGYDRVTAMVIDPERLYVYWEVTDDAVAAARAGLGPAGANAWLNLRVYDISGRLFDGTNAHSYFDHRVERHDRQWFFVINKPTSSACVEVGLKSEEGYFAKIVRSGRAEFPRREPMPGGPVEWLTVRATGEIQGHHHGGAPGNGAAAGGRQARGGRPRRRTRPRRRDAGLGRLDGALRRIPDARRQPRHRPSLGVAGAERRRVDRRGEADRMVRAAPADRVGIGTVHLSDRGPLVGGGGSRRR